MLKLDINFKGIEVKSAQAFLGAITISESHNEMTFAVNFRAHADSEIFMTEYLSCEYDPASGSPVDQAYAYVQNLDSFSNATLVN